ncbi:hypothetical protein Nepgr_023976 [Nepenthes gracilis]|uniref:Uncharacterized protein n=1 Tax=Nepenthes gracilis TaxID=150966 RepID=A0AAD3T377_NEPGR|nr:hypothetical protein Nepgr_023976 [Nepenthes gracilis]
MVSLECSVLDVVGEIPLASMAGFGLSLRVTHVSLLDESSRIGFALVLLWGLGLVNDDDGGSLRLEITCLWSDLWFILYYESDEHEVGATAIAGFLGTLACRCLPVQIGPLHDDDLILAEGYTEHGTAECHWTQLLAALPHVVLNT